MDENTLLFAEWIDLNGIRNNEHEWKYKGDNYVCRYSTEEMYQLFLAEEKDFFDEMNQF
jgi:hypothetical protein